MTKCDRNIDPAREATAVGDLNSDAPGSGARKNEGKPQMDLIPVGVWRRSWHAELTASDTPHTLVRQRLFKLLAALELWQEGKTWELTRYLQQEAVDYDMDAAVRVFEFGAKKYKAWNWAKGMDWSVPTGCILRHAKRILDGELVDSESDETHMGHIVCNLIMLERYASTYTAGDDRPPGKLA